MKNISVFLAIPAVLLLQGCASGDLSLLGESDIGPLPDPVAVMTPGASLPRVDAPKVKVTVGDQFTFDNPSQTWTVVDDAGDRIVWESASGGRLITHYNIMLPALIWDTGDERGRRAIVDVSGALFPLKEGNVISFDAEGQSDRPPSRWRASWMCSVEAKTEIKVKAGTSETWPIRCRRNNSDMLLFHYAPKMGHYVRYESKQQGYSSVRQLTAYARNAAVPRPKRPSAAPKAASSSK